MNKSRGFIVILMAALVLLSSVACLAVFPEPLGFGGSRMKQGWFANTEAWYIEGGATTPKLASLLQPRELGGEIAARPVYIVLNPGATQGPVFSAAPGQNPVDVLYSGFWQVFYIQWKPGVIARPIINATPGDPRGLPDASEADIVLTTKVVQLPIVAIGPLGGPWLPAPPGRYRIKQGFAMADYARSKLVFLPVYEAFCRDRVRRYVFQSSFVVPDAVDSAFADLVGANLAPGLLNVPDGTIDPNENDTQAFYWIPNSPWQCQFPILEACPFFTSRGVQTNTNFTPVARIVELGRNIPYSTVINNPEYVRHLLSTGGLIILDDSDRAGLLVFVGG